MTESSLNKKRKVELSPKKAVSVERTWVGIHAWALGCDLLLSLL